MASRGYTYKHGIEWLRNTPNGRGVVGHRERSDERDAPMRVCLGIGRIKALRELHVLRHTLQHARRLVEEHRERNLRQVLPNAVLQHRPQAHRRPVVRRYREVVAQLQVGRVHLAAEELLRGRRLDERLRDDEVRERVRLNRVEELVLLVRVTCLVV